MSDREERNQDSASPAAFWDDFAREHGRELQRCAARAMRAMGWRAAPADVEELVQEVYCRLLERRDGAAALRDRPAPQRWAFLHRIVRSVVVDELRNRAAKKRGGGARQDHHGERMLQWRAPGASPEERLVVRERARELRRRVCELGGPEHGPRNARILELSAIEGCTAAEIARRMGTLTASSVHTVLHRLRRQLADAY